MADIQWKEKLEEIKEKQKTVKAFVGELLKEVRKANAELNDEDAKRKADRVFKAWLRRVTGDDEDESGRKIDGEFTRSDQEEAARHFMAARKRAVDAEDKLAHIRTLFTDKKTIQAATGKADADSEEIYGCIYANPNNSAARRGAAGGEDATYTAPDESIYANPAAGPGNGIYAAPGAGGGAGGGGGDEAVYGNNMDGNEYAAPGMLIVGGGGAIYANTSTDIYGAGGGGGGGEAIYGNNFAGETIYGMGGGAEAIYGNNYSGEQMYGTPRIPQQYEEAIYGNRADGEQMYAPPKPGNAYQADEAIYGNRGATGEQMYAPPPSRRPGEYEEEEEDAVYANGMSQMPAEYGVIGHGDDGEPIYGNAQGQLYGVISYADDGTAIYGNTGGQVSGQYGVIGYGTDGEAIYGNAFTQQYGVFKPKKKKRGGGGDAGGGAYGNRAGGGGGDEYAAFGGAYGNGSGRGGGAEYGSVGGDAYGNRAGGGGGAEYGQFGGDAYGNRGGRGGGGAEYAASGVYNNRLAGGGGDSEYAALGAPGYGNAAGGGGGGDYGAFGGGGAGGIYGNTGKQRSQYQAGNFQPSTGEEIYAAVQQKIGDSIADVRSDYAEAGGKFDPSADGFGVNGRRLKTVSVYTKERRRKDVTEVSGYLLKQSENKRGWKRRWFVLEDGMLMYFHEKEDVGKVPPAATLPVHQITRVMKTDNAKQLFTFEVQTPRRPFILAGETSDSMKTWIKSLQNIMKRSAGDEEMVHDAQGVAISGWLTKVKAGRAKRRFFVLLSRVLYYYRSPKDRIPLAEIYLMDTNIEDVPEDDSSEEDVSDIEADVPGDALATPHGHLGKKNSAGSSMPKASTAGMPKASMAGMPGASVAGLPGNGASQLLRYGNDNYNEGFYCFGLKTRYANYFMQADTSEQKEKWMFFIVQTGTGSQLYLRTETERIVAALANRGHRIDDPLLERTVVSFNMEQAITEPLTTLPTKGMESKAMKVLDKILQFAGVPFDPREPEFHVKVAQELVRICLKESGIASEVYCQLIKLTNNHPDPDSPLAMQCWQILALCCGIFLPGKHVRQYLDVHLRRHALHSTTEHGKYAMFCQRVVKKQIKTGQRQWPPSRVEVMALCSQNPYTNELSMCVPVYLIDGSMIEVRFDPGTTCKELMLQVNQQLGLVDAQLTGMGLYLGLLRRDEGGKEKGQLPSRKASIVGRSSVIDTVVKEVSKFGTQDPEKAAKQSKEPAKKQGDKHRRKQAQKLDQMRGTSEALKIRQMLEKRSVDPDRSVNDERRQNSSAFAGLFGKKDRKSGDATSLRSGVSGASATSMATMNSVNSYTSGRSSSGNRRQAGLASRKAVADSMKGRSAAAQEHLLIDSERFVSRPKLESEGRSLLDNDNMCDILAEWESFSKSHIQRLVLTFKRRLYFRRKNALESLSNEVERKLIFHQLNEEIVNGRYPLDEDIMVTFAALQAQVQYGREKTEKQRWLWMPDVLENYVNPMFITAGTAKMVMDKWEDLADMTKDDCINRYLAIFAEWSFHGATLFYAETEQANPFDPVEPLWLAVSEEGISILGYEDLTAYVTYKYQRVMSFANTVDDFMLTVRVPKDDGENGEEITEKLSFSTIQAAEVVSLVRSYINRMVLDNDLTCDYAAMP